MRMVRRACALAGLVGAGLVLAMAALVAGAQGRIPQLMTLRCESIISLEGKDNYAA